MSWDDRFARFRKRIATVQTPRHRHEVALKVPDYLKDVKPSQYTPHTVSLGLNFRLEPGIEHHKAAFQRSFLKWKTNHAKPAALNTQNHDATDNSTPAEYAPAFTWDQYIEDLKLDTDVQTASRWYQIDMDPIRPIILKNFLAQDALFLVLFLRCSYHNSPSITWHLPDFDQICKEIEEETEYRLLAEARSGIWRDVFLLENQIPLHILAKVWISMPDMKSRPEDEALEFFNKLLREVVKGRYLELFEIVSEDQAKVVSNVLNDKNFLGCDHLLDCLHYAVSYSPPDENKSLRTADEKAFAPANTIPSATLLRKVGIRLSSDGCNFIHEIKFDNSSWFRSPVLYLPRLCISDRTESLLRNLAVFEMVSWYQAPRLGPRLSTITSFLILMDKLIDTEADVRLMRKQGIITSCLGSDVEMCEMWNTMCTRFSLYQHSIWVEMLKKLMTRYRNRRHQYFAEFRERYFARPWAVASWVAAGMLILLTALQTVYVVVAYHKPPKVR